MDDQLDFSNDSDPLRPLPDLDTTTTPSHLASFHQSSWPQLYIPTSSSAHSPLSSTLDMDINNSASESSTSLHSPVYEYNHPVSESTSALGITTTLTSGMPQIPLQAYANDQQHLQIRTSMASSQPGLQSADLTLQQALNVSNMLQPSPFSYGLPNSQAFNPVSQLAYAQQVLDMPLHSSPTQEYSTSTAPMQPLHSFMLGTTMSQMPPMTTMSSPNPGLSAAEMYQLVSEGWNPVGMPLSQGYVNPISAHSSPDSHDLLGSRSLSNQSDHSWTFIDGPSNRNSLDGFSDSSHSQVVSPQILHVRSDSDSSDHRAPSTGSFDDIEIFPVSPEPHSRNSPDHFHTHRPILPAPTPTQHSPSSSPPNGSPSKPKPRKTSPANTTTTPKTIAKRKTNSVGSVKDVKNNEKRVGRRRGPLRPEQRQSAHEIRKLRACLRCKFLKKVCDKGDPCTGCQPSHARLWQVPCTRIDIRDIGYFLKDWTADYERHVTLGFSVANIKSFDTHEEDIFITHGYGFCLPVKARRVLVHNTDCFESDWVESKDNLANAFEVGTSHLATGAEGISKQVISEYIDLHLDKGFDLFIQEYFDNTPFLSEVLRSIHRYYVATGQENIRKGLKLVIAYALTCHITLLHQVSDNHNFEVLGRIDDPASKFYMQVCAPVMINFQVKKAMAELWRELMQEVLSELSTLYSSVYSGEKFRNWPSIFMLAVLILSVWEMMQFDANYRVPDEAVANKFCKEMEHVPVGVIVGLFCAISTKLPNFLEWETEKHGALWNGNPAICETMTSVRAHVEQHGK
jgi:hypothetical protein